jgi:hypothetical protein
MYNTPNIALNFKLHQTNIHVLARKAKHMHAVKLTDFCQFNKSEDNLFPGQTTPL